MTFKKLLSLCAISFSIFALSACSSSNSKTPTAEFFETYNGQFKSLGGINVDEVVTHLFENDEGDIFYSYSRQYDLDSDIYTNSDLEIFARVQSFDHLDKDLVEVRRITVLRMDNASEAILPDEEVREMNHKDLNLGVSFVYSSDWTLTDESTSLRLVSPLTEEQLEVEEAFELDSILITQHDLFLELNEESVEHLENQLSVAVQSAFPSLVGMSYEKALIGPDSLFSIVYRFGNGDVSYFVPRNDHVYEIAYIHPSEDEVNLAFSNQFARLISGFRFLPRFDASTEPSNVEPEIILETSSDEPELELEVPETETEPETMASAADEFVETVETSEPEESVVPAASSISTEAVVDANLEPVSFRSFSPFTSKLYGFEGVYPGPWYYYGHDNGYDFGPNPFHEENEDAEVIIRLDINSGDADGVRKEGSKVFITKTLGDKSFTVHAGLEYESVLNELLNAIVLLEEPTE